MSTTPPTKLDIRAAIEEGVALLRKNMAMHPPFDPKRPYEEKNAYFIEVARRGEEYLFMTGLFWVAELYFKTMLKEILQYEQTHSKHFNKGLLSTVSA